MFPSLSFYLPSSLLPVLTTLIGIGGLTVGVYSFINPIAAARIYGIPVPTVGKPSTSGPPDLTAWLANTPSPTELSSTKPTSEQAHENTAQAAYQRAIIHALGIRNLTAGLTIISLSAFWQFGLVNASEETRLVLQRVLGMVLVIGSLVPAVDAWVCGMGGQDNSVGRKAAWLHGGRGLLWLAVGLRCHFTGLGVESSGVRC